MRTLYAGIDLHSTNCFIGIIDDTGKHVFQRRLPNDKKIILDTLAQFKQELVSIVIESTYNWYWLVDCLMDEGYAVQLANPSAIQQYRGLKHKDDRHDSFWLAAMAQLGILPTGYIYPKKDRPLRDLLRKRGHLVDLRTSLVNSLQGIISRNNGWSINANKIKQKTENNVSSILEGNDDLALAGQVSKDLIDFMSDRIYEIEKRALGQLKPRPGFQELMTIPGVGNILSLTIMLEVGDIKRFQKAGNFVSYCRKAPSNWISNKKKKGKGNTKNGNKYLAWAFSEAAVFARRYNLRAKAFFNRKMSQTTTAVAHAALAHKLARAAYYIMRDRVVFDENKLFA